MNVSPRVSIVLPTYNYARFLPEAIESVLGQDYQDFELLIADDHSKDDSAEILRAYASKDSRVRSYVHEQNLGMVANWNWCLHQAKGTYVKYLFGDDKLASPQTIGKMASLLDHNPNAALAVSARSILDEHSRIVDVWNHLGPEGLHSGRSVGRNCLLRLSNLIGEPSVVMLRKDLAQRGFDERYRQVVDLEMWFHLLQKGDLVYTSEPLCQFRRHAQQQTEVNKHQYVGMQEMVHLLESYKNFFLPEDAQLTKSEAVEVFKTLRRDCTRTLAGCPDELQANLAKGLLPYVIQRTLSSSEKWMIFKIVHALRNEKRKGPLNEGQSLLESALSPKLGDRSYWALWLRYRITRPFLDLRHALRKSNTGSPEGPAL